MDTNSRPNDASADSDVLGELMRHLLPTPAISPPKATAIQSDYELLIQCLLGTVQSLQPVVQERSSKMGIEVLLQSMLLVVSVVEDKVRPPGERREPTTGCFSCGEADHRVDDEFVLRPPPPPPPKGATCHQAGNVN